MIRSLIHRKYSLKCNVDKYHIEVENFQFQCFQHFLPFFLVDEMEVLAPCSPNPLLCILRTTVKPRLGCPPAPQVYLIPKAAVTNYHKLRGLWQQKFILLSSCQKGHASSKSSEESPSLPFLALVGGLQPLVFLGLWQHTRISASIITWTTSLHVCLCPLALFF